MDSRQKELLRHIIEEYIDTAQPVGSAVIAEKRMSDVPGPTIRNEMQELERLKFISQPHTSAGRVPTEVGYRFYLNNLLPERELSGRNRGALERSASGSRDSEGSIKQLAKKTAELSGETVVVGFAPRDTFYTGLSNLFDKPEFIRHDLVVSLSAVIDHLDDIMLKMHKRLDNDIAVLLGSDNPFGEECGSVLTACKFSRGRGVVGILGPMRMDYGENIAYVKFIKKLLEK